MALRIGFELRQHREAETLSRHPSCCAPSLSLRRAHGPHLGRCGPASSGLEIGAIPHLPTFPFDVPEGLRKWRLQIPGGSARPPQNGAFLPELHLCWFLSLREGTSPPASSARQEVKEIQRNRKQVGGSQRRRRGGEWGIHGQGVSLSSDSTATVLSDAVLWM